MIGAIAAALIVGRIVAPAPRALAVPPALGTPAVRWVVDVGAVQAVPELVAHPPVVAGDRVLVAGSRIGHVALDRAGGAVAWRRPGGATLSAPLVITPRDVVLVRECDAAIGAPAATAVIACFDVVDPIDVAARTAGMIHAPAGDADGCLLGGRPWQLTADAGALVLAGPTCAFTARLPGGAARLIAKHPAAEPPQPGDDCGRLDDGTPWCQRVDGATSHVELHGAELPGLSVLAAARDRDRLAVVVRGDATLRNDVLHVLRGGTLAWSWPLPAPPPGERSTPIGVSIGDAGVFLLFDSSKVAAFDAP